MVENNAEKENPNEGRRIHGLAEQAREEGRFLDALTLTDEAMLSYQANKDLLGFSEVLSSRFLTLRHLYDQTGDKAFLITAKHTVQSSVDIARESGDLKSLAIPLFNLAKAQESTGELSVAAATYQEAVTSLIANTPDSHSRPSILADFKVFQYTCEYKTGDKSALERAQSALADLEATEEQDIYAKDVWVSGGYMRIAEMLKDDDRDRAQESLNKAKKVIESNPKLSLRMKQWEKLAATFK